MSAASTGFRRAAYDSRARYFSWAAKRARPAGSGSFTAPTPSTTRRIAGRTSTKPMRWNRTMPRLKLPPRPTRTPCRARAAAQGSRRLLHPGRLQGRQDGQGQSPASASGRRVGCVREPPTRTCAATSKPSMTDARWRNSPRSSTSEGKQGALLRRGADDPGQARAARAGHRQTRRRRNRAGAERVRRAPSRRPNSFRAPTAAARSARFSSATPSRSWSLRSS